MDQTLQFGVVCLNSNVFSHKSREQMQWHQCGDFRRQVVPHITCYVKSLLQCRVFHAASIIIHRTFCSAVSLCVSAIRLYLLFTYVKCCLCYSHG